MAQIQGSPEGGRAQRRTPAAQLANVALRSAGQIYDLQMTAARLALRNQARAAAAFGWPDMSGLFDSVDERTRRVFSEATEQMANTAQRANEAAAELQREVGRLVESQTAVAAENWQRGLEELGAQAEQGFTELCETTRRTVEEAEETSRAAGEATRETIRESGEAGRQVAREGAEVSRQAMREGGDLARQGSDAGQQAAREGAEAVRQGGGTARDRKAA